MVEVNGAEKVRVSESYLTDLTRSSELRFFSFVLAENSPKFRKSDFEISGNRIRWGRLDFR